MLRQPKRSQKTQPPKTSWEKVSDWYADYLSQNNTLQSEVVFPKTVELLNLKPNQELLDIACGEGSFTRLIAKQKRVHTTGIDASPSLIEKAKQKALPLNKYLVADAKQFNTKLVGQRFDAAVCILAIQNIDHMEAVFEQTSKSIKSNAPFVIVMNHPCFRQPRQSGWGWDEERKLQYRRIDRYLNEYEMPIIAHPGAAPTVKTFSYHHPISSYINALGKNHFVIERMEEWISHKQSDSGPRAKAENIARAEIPLFLAIRAIKKET